MDWAFAFIIGVGVGIGGTLLWQYATEPVALPCYKTQPPSCEICGQEAYVWLNWGSHGEGQEGYYCRDHKEEIWVSVQPQVKAGVCHWTQLSVNNKDIPA